ncbi:hypothetical protein DdX_12111 [Ditylenchus destructor]|uniref:G-protein coupled receptors family 1 profile domain-containing protein n=1 Tax=Ditylenchus destructor TaxID=166010 RepID=A0AAD4R437_9BILA|nr:hypothetical protein DdX_12111 [Ditylenchus destructor]
MEESTSEITRIVGTSCYLAMSSLSLTVNVLLIAIFVKSHSQIKSVSFFILTWQLLICDVLSLMVQFVLVIPQIFVGHSTLSILIQIYESEARNQGLKPIILKNTGQLCLRRMILGIPFDSNRRDLSIDTLLAQNSQTLETSASIFQRSEGPEGHEAELPRLP